MPKLLEVIVTSEEEAAEAQAGGADRLELVHDLGSGGLTPGLQTVQAVLEEVHIPVRVMLRNTASMVITDEHELAAILAELPIDGLVLGSSINGEVDFRAIQRIITVAPQIRVTFHRAFEQVTHPLKAIEQLKRFRQIDRILTSGGDGLWTDRRARLLDLQNAADPEMTVLVAAGVCPDTLRGLRDEPALREIHVGRAAREPQTVSGRISKQRIAALKNALA